MNFVYPEFLWALSALSIPIAIHIFNFRRLRRVYFSNVQLLKEVKTQTNSLRRLKHFLVLLSRLAFLTALVLAFAQPYFPSENQKTIKNLSGLVSLYLDNSYSMQSEVGNDQYLDIASRYITDLVKVFPQDARFQMISNKFENQEQFPVSASEIEDRLSENTFSSEYRTLPILAERQNNLLSRFSEGKANQVFWFSDFQKSTVGDLNKIRLDSLNQYYIVPIRSEQTPNLMIDSVWLENPFIKALESNQVNVRLKSFSQESYSDLTLKLFIDEQQVSTTTVNLAPGESQVTNFNFTVQGEGIKPGRITFEDFPVIFDNEYYFVINASPKVRVLQLYESDGPKYIENVYSNESVFNVQSFNVNNLDYTRIENAELIILNEVKALAGELSTKLQEFARAGGSIMIIPPLESESSFTTFIGALNIPNFRQSRPDSLGVGSANELALLNINNPFYQGIFEKVPQNMNMPYANAVADWSNVGENLLQFKNRRPYLSRFQIQKGKVYLFATPFQKEYSNFAKHALFVPIMYNIASQSKPKGERPAYTFQEKTLRIPLDETPNNQVYKLVKDELEIIPDQRIVGDELLLEMPVQALEAGYYKLMQNEKMISLLAFNYGKAESAMEFYSQEEIQGAFANQKNVQVFDFSKSQNFIADFRAKNIQINLWKYFLMAALAFLLLEIILIRVL